MEVKMTSFSVEMQGVDMPDDNVALGQLLRDPAIIKVVRILNVASLSILELLESGLNRQDIVRALSRITSSLAKSAVASSSSQNIDGRNLASKSGDYYFGFLNSKLKLSMTGLQILMKINNKIMIPTHSETLQ
jgi:hypothetical protein